MKYKVTLKGKTYEVEVEKGEAMVVAEYEALAPAVPAAAAPAPAAAAPAAVSAAPAAASAQGTNVVSPLPGNVLNINVKVGDTVKAGDLLVMIEAMKMENEVLAASDGVVKQILTSKGAVVATGDVLMVI